jgi:hypothetical protein
MFLREEKKLKKKIIDRDEMESSVDALCCGIQRMFEKSIFLLLNLLKIFTSK